MNELTLLLFSMRARSHTATSPANLLNSFTWLSRSADHLLTISSMVLPRSIDGGGTDMDGTGAAVVDEDAAGTRRIDEYISRANQFTSYLEHPLPYRLPST